MTVIAMGGLKDFQTANCKKGCKFADKKALAKGHPCCTFAFGADNQDGICKTRR